MLRLTVFVAWFAASIWNCAYGSEVRVVDDMGREVVLPEPARRIVSLAPHNTENLFSAGAGDRVVGVVTHSDFPPAALDIPHVGNHVIYNLEMIVSLKPDLVVAWFNGNSQDSLERLERMGLALYMSEPRTFQDIVDNIVDLATLSGTLAQMDPDVNTILQRLESSRIAYKESQILDVFYQVWTDPLITLNDEHFISRVVEYCGGSNVFGQLPLLAPRISLEAVVQKNPDVIVTGMIDNEKPDMSLWADWQSIRAVQRQNFAFVDPDVMHRHTLRMLKGIPGLCEQFDRTRRNMGAG